MALWRQLADELMCPIDLDYYEHPVQLRCLHVLCEKDVKHMVGTSGQIRCPVCQRTSESSDVKQDFRTARLIELLKQDRNRKEAGLCCEFCEEEMATCQCRECVMYFCDRCKRGHLKTPSRKQHTFDAIKSLVNDSKEIVKMSLVDLKKEYSRCENVNLSWNSLKLENGEKSRGIRQQIDDSETAIIEKVKVAHGRLRQELKAQIEQESSVIEENMANLDCKLQVFNKRVRLLEELIEGDDETTLLNKACLEELLSQSPTFTQEDDTTYETNQKGIVSISLSPNEKVFRALNEIKLKWVKTEEKEGSVLRAISGVVLRTAAEHIGDFNDMLQRHADQSEALLHPSQNSIDQT